MNETWRWWWAGVVVMAIGLSVFGEDVCVAAMGAGISPEGCLPVLWLGGLGWLTIVCSRRIMHERRGVHFMMMWVWAVVFGGCGGIVSWVYGMTFSPFW